MICLVIQWNSSAHSGRNRCASLIIPVPQTIHLEGEKFEFYYLLGKGRNDSLMVKPSRIQAVVCSCFILTCMLAAWHWCLCSHKAPFFSLLTHQTQIRRGYGGGCRWQPLMHPCSTRGPQSRVFQLVLAGGCRLLGEAPWVNGCWSLSMLSRGLAGANSTSRREIYSRRGARKWENCTTTAILYHSNHSAKQ